VRDYAQRDILSAAHDSQRPAATIETARARLTRRFFGGLNAKAEDGVACYLSPQDTRPGSGSPRQPSERATERDVASTRSFMEAVTPRELRFVGLSCVYLTDLAGREQHRSGVSASNSRSPAVARRLPRRTTLSAGAKCNRRVTARIREFDARGWAVRELRAATSLRWAGVMPKCAVGLPRVAGGCEGDRLHTWACGWRVLLVAARDLAMQSAAGACRENDQDGTPRPWRTR